jgi:hypothetical protein
LVQRNPRGSTLRALKLAVLSESSADEAAIRILVEAILELQTAAILLPSLRSRGWPAVRQILPSVLKHLHYRTDADALAVVVDSDKSRLHLHEGTPCQCRSCELRDVARETQSNLRSKPARPAIKLAIGLAVPSIEAWFRCGIDPHVTEASWAHALQSNHFLYTAKRLKHDVYGSETPGLSLQTQHAVDASRRLARQLDTLKTWFPAGFGLLLDDVSRW